MYPDTDCAGEIRMLIVIRKCKLLQNAYPTTAMSHFGSAAEIEIPCVTSLNISKNLQRRQRESNEGEGEGELCTYVRVASQVDVVRI